MNLVERIERLEKLIGAGEVPADIQDIGRLVRFAEGDVESLQSLLYSANREMWLAKLGQYDFRILWGDVLPVIFREAKRRGYLHMKEGDIFLWGACPVRISVRFPGTPGYEEGEPT